MDPMRVAKPAAPKACRSRAEVVDHFNEQLLKLHRAKFSETGPKALSLQSRAGDASMWNILPNLGPWCIWSPGKPRVPGVHGPRAHPE